MWNALLTVAITAVASLVLLFFLCKLMGNRQISELSMYDYIIGITIGSIAAELATELETPLYPALAMVLYAVFAFGISVATAKSRAVRRFVSGSPILLLDGGMLYRENLKRARFDLSDFLTLCRINGYFDLSDLETAILEENGTVSFLPKAGKRPLTPEDVSVFPPAASVTANVILDGVLLTRTVAALGFTEAWLLEQLALQGHDGPGGVFLATLDRAGKLTVFPMTKEQPGLSIFG